MKALNDWLAGSPLASWLKVFVASALGWVILNLDTLPIHPAIVLGLASMLPMVVNYLNPSDTRYNDYRGDNVSDVDA